MATIKFVLRKDKNRKEGTAPVYLRITQNRRSSYIHTGIWVAPNDWNGDRQQVRRSNPQYQSLNDEIKRLGVEAQGADLSLRTRGKSTAKAIKLKVQGIGASSLVSYAEAYAEGWKKNGKYWEYKKVHVLINKLKAFSKRKALSFRDLDREFLDGFATYMREELNNKRSTQQKNLQILRSIVKRAVTEGVIPVSDDPFLYYTIGTSTASRERLTIDGIRSLEGLVLEPVSRLDIARDLFLFGFYAHGMRFGDLITLRWRNVVEGRLDYTMMKSEKVKSVKLKGGALGILEKYRAQGEGGDSFIFPVLEPDCDYSDPFFVRRRISSKNAMLNKELKTLAEMIKTPVNLSFHVARHSFADYARRGYKDLYAVSKALGHSKLETTQRYLSSFDLEAEDKLTDALFD